MCWPKEQGGEGRNLLYQFIFVEEMEYLGMPYGNLTYTSIAPSIQHFGSEDQKAALPARHLPGRATASRSATASPTRAPTSPPCAPAPCCVGDEWVINGQKIWTSLADVSTHIWLAARTDPDLRKHRASRC